MAEQPHALSAHALSVSLGGRTVLDQISLALSFGEILAVLGPNGAGKSTLLRALSGLVAYRGEIWSEGQLLSTLAAQERAQRLSFVPQQSQLSAALAVREVVALGRYARRPALAGRSSADEAAIEQALCDTDALGLAERAFSDLSSGEQKRVLLARALCTGARTLLFDEPTSTLDIEHALGLFALLRSLAERGRAIIVVLHQLEHALAFADRALLLQRGEQLALGTVAEVLTAENVRKLHRVELVPNGAPAFRLLRGDP